MLGRGTSEPIKYKPHQLLIEGACCFLLLGCVALESKRLPLMDASLAGIVDLGESISLDVLKVEYRPLGLTVIGILDNNSGKKWEDLTFELTITDEDGIPYTKEVSLRSDLLPLKIGPTRTEIQFFLFQQRITSIAKKGKLIKGSYTLRYGISMLQPVVAPDPHYNDHNIDIAFAFERSQIGIAIKNKTNDPIILDWNAASFVDATSAAHRVFHEGIRLIDRNNPQPAATIPPLSTLRDFLAPTSYVFWSGKDWAQHPILPPGPQGEALEGLEIGIFLPLTIKGLQKSYNFRFKIESVEPEQ